MPLRRCRPGRVFNRRIEREPLGLVLDIAAWNYPLLIAVNVVVPALAAGNAVLLKHSAKTPLCGEHFQKAFGYLPGLMTSLVLTHDQTLDLIRDPRVDHVVFTGSVNGGRHVHRAAAGRFIDVGLELGGKDPAYVAEDADLAASVPGWWRARYTMAGSPAAPSKGSMCIARFTRPSLNRPVKSWRTIDPAIPWILKRAWGRWPTVRPWKCWKARCRMPWGAGPVCWPAANAWKERRATSTFRPSWRTWTTTRLSCRRRVSDRCCRCGRWWTMEEALAQMNASRYGLTASVWTRSRERAEWFAARLEAGTVYLEPLRLPRPGAAWTGVKDSGRGSSLSRYGYYALTRPKSINFRDGAA